MVLGDVASWHRFYLAAKPSHVGFDVDGVTPHVSNQRDYGNHMFKRA
jgi:hypothetical protein